MDILYDIIREHCNRLIKERQNKINKMASLNIQQIQLTKEKRNKLSDEINHIRLALQKIGEGMSEILEIDK